MKIIIIIIIIVKIIFFPLWILIAIPSLLIWVGLFDSYDMWEEVFIDNYFNLNN